MIPQKLLKLLLLVLLYAESSTCTEENKEDLEKFLLPMISEGAVYNQTMFEMEEDHERLCGQEGRLVKEKGNMLVQCSSDSECLPPSQCHSSGYCCMIALHQEPPPVGCPMGTRSLRNISGIELTCNPAVPNSCPGGATCYTDSLTQQKRCCGEDPGQGCPAGSRAVMTSSSSPMQCTPGRTTCPSGALCQWSHLIDRYQCCEPDNGCPRHQSPLKTDRGETVSCSPGGPPCPGGAGCRFNFWTASHQCCRTDTADLCPSGQVPFLKESDASPRSCNKDTECPTGFVCGDNKLCCGEPGSCPNAHAAMVDAYGRLTACSSRNANTCPGGSSCQQTSIVSQKLCCIQEDYKCPGLSTPFPSVRRPQTCLLGDPFGCSQGQCMPSNVDGVSICCKSAAVPRQQSVNPCPSGWALQDNTISFCKPSSHSSTCSGFSSCVRSSSVQQQFVCCIPAASPVADTCQRAGSTPERTNGHTRKCMPGSMNQCGAGFSCQPSVRNGWLCCSSPRAQAQSQFSCPLNGQTAVISPQGNNQFCSMPGQRGECPQNALCLAAGNSANLYICCYSGPQVTPICPNNALPQPSTSGYVACADNTNNCDFGYSCVRAANDYSVQMCCSSQALATPSCPNQQTLLMDLGRPRSCLPSQLSACPSGYSCQAALGTPGTYVCCSLPATATCPAQFTASLDTTGNSIFCSPSQPAGCPSGSVCLQSPSTDSLFLCCRSASSPRVCPNSLNALLTPSGSLETCNGPGSSCSRLGYSCQLSTVLAQYVCCGMEQQNVVCADGRETFTQTSGQTYTCNALSFPTGCPVGYDCAQSTVSGTNVCCKGGGTPVFPPQPTDNLQCPNGWNPHRNAIDNQPRTCSGTMDMSCPIGFSCTPSSINNIFVCCRLATSLSCPRGSTFLVNNQPRLCSRNRVNQCPRGYSCEQSTNPTVTICCSSSQLDESITCPDRSQPALINGNIRSCPLVNSVQGCPDNYFCQKSNKAINVCCQSIGSTRLSPSLSFSSNQPGSSVQCPNGVRAGSLPSSCRTNADCPAQSTCQPSTNVPGVSLCCASSVPSDTRCLARRTMLANSKPVECLQGNSCEDGCVCSSKTNNGRSVCCENEAKSLGVCPESRVPYIVARTEKVMYCDETAYTCPSGMECKQTVDKARFVCCSAIVTCKQGTPQFENGLAKRCFSSDSCGAGFDCSDSTVDGASVCCSGGLTPLKEIFASPARAEVVKDDEDQEWVVLEG